MHRFLAIAIAGSAMSLAAAASTASEVAARAAERVDRCAPVAPQPFRPQAELHSVVGSFGYRVLHFGADAGCYAVRAVDRQGRQFDLKFEGANLRMVSRRFARPETEVIAQW